jgi:hypothetical protein
MGGGVTGEEFDERMGKGRKGGGVDRFERREVGEGGW